MTLLSIPVSYSDILQRRREMRAFKTDSPALYYKQTTNGYILYLNDGNISLRSDLVDESEISDFETDAKQYCNRHDFADGQLILTNDLGNNVTWIDTDNSVSVIMPADGKEHLINSLTGTVDTDVAFGSSVYHVSVWSGLSEPCPEYNDEATAFGIPLYNPAGQVYSGWMKVAPSITNQNWEAWVYFNNNVPAYRVVDYKFTSFTDMVKKSSFRIFGKTAYIVHSFKELSINLFLKSSNNDRIESYVSDHTELSSPNSVPLQMCGMVLEYTEW